MMISSILYYIKNILFKEKSYSQYDTTYNQSFTRKIQEKIWQQFFDKRQLNLSLIGMAISFHCFYALGSFRWRFVLPLLQRQGIIGLESETTLV